MTEFDEHCKECVKETIDIVTAHIYSVNPGGVFGQFDTLHKRWPEKKLWITELAPATKGMTGCRVTPEQERGG